MINPQRPEILVPETPAVLTWTAPAVEILNVQNLTELNPFGGDDAFASAS